MATDLTICWIALATAFMAAFATYRWERYKYGGLGLCSLLAAGVLLYNLFNPLFYLIHPLLAPKYALYLGFYEPPEVLLPNIVAAAVFLVSLSAATRFSPPAYAIAQPCARPVPQRNLHRLLGIVLLLSVVGFIFYCGRNVVVFGRWNGSFTADYTGVTARPQVPVFSSYTNFWAWAIEIISVVCLWQHAAGRLGVILMSLPLLIGGFFAVIEGDRVLLGTAVLLFAGWFGLRASLSLRKIALALTVLTLLTSVANARYHKGKSSLGERVADIFRPEYFRPFWSSDPTGPALVATLESWRSSQEGISFGTTYVKNFLSMAPKALWPGRPDDTTIEFARWYQEREGLEYAPGTGYAFNAVTEAQMSFWYLGPALLGLLCARVGARLTRWSLARRDLAGRAVFAFGTQLIVFHVPRASVMVFFSPFMILNYFLIAFLIRSCAAAETQARPMRHA